jgi:hypothetical protein
MGLDEQRMTPACKFNDGRHELDKNQRKEISCQLYFSQ